MGSRQDRLAIHSCLRYLIPQGVTGVLGEQEAGGDGGET